MNPTNISVAEPVEIQIDDLGNNVITMCEFVGDINDNKALGLDIILNCINDALFAKHEGAVNQINTIRPNNNYFQYVTTYTSNKI